LPGMPQAPSIRLRHMPATESSNLDRAYGHFLRKQVSLSIETCHYMYTRRLGAVDKLAH
jgi:hypothetical protein